jgi:hypothetical protein
MGLRMKVRWKRRRKWAAWAVSPLVLLLIVRLVWGIVAERRMVAARADLVKAGVRMDPALPAVSDENNAAAKIIEALHALSLSEADAAIISTHTGVMEERMPPDADKVLIRDMITKNARTLALISSAGSLPIARWPTSISDAVEKRDHPIGKLRLVADLLYVAAMVVHEDGRDTQALENLRLILVLGRVADRDPAIVGHYVAIALRSLTSAGVERIEASLRLRKEDGSMAAARELLRELVDDAFTQEALAIAWEAECDAIAMSPYLEARPFWSWWFAPLRKDEATRRMKEATAFLPVVRARDWPAVVAAGPLRPVSQPWILDVATMHLQTNRYGSLYSVTRLHIRAIVDGRAASLMLAARIHQAETGAVPERADQLVPAILQRMPVDPYAADGRTMRYRRDPAGITIWSVGENGMDEAGDPIPLRPVYIRRHAMSSDVTLNSPDVVYGDGWRKAKAAAAVKPAAPTSTFPP